MGANNIKPTTLSSELADLISCKLMNAYAMLFLASYFVYGL